MLKFVDKIISIIYPKRCPFCDKIIKTSLDICDDCKSNVMPIFIKRSIFLSGKEIPCISPFKYTGDVAESIKRFKFRGRKEYSTCLAKFMLETFNLYYRNNTIDFVTSVPLHSKRKRERGYNQAEVLVRILGYELNLTYKEALKKDKINLQQHNLSYEEREDNVKGVYSAKNKDIIKGSKILICDDVITTGNTLKECCRVLYENGADEVLCITLASTKLK